MPDLKRTSILSTGRDPGAQKPRHAEPMRDSWNRLSRQPDGRSIPTCSSYTAVSCPHVVVTGQIGLSTSHPPRHPQEIPKSSTGCPQVVAQGSVNSHQRVPQTGHTAYAHSKHTAYAHSKHTAFPLTREVPPQQEGQGHAMHCPFCRHNDSRVIDSRTADDGTAIRRRRQCQECNRRFTTVETASLSVVKRSGVTEPFSRGKVLVGVRKACQGRPVSEDDLARLAQRVEEDIRSQGSAEIDAHEVGMAILGPLRELDEIAYLRFASVYQAFDNLEDFESAITLLRAEREVSNRERDPAPGEPPARGGMPGS